MTPARAKRTVRPTKADLEAARDKRVADVIAPDLRVLFCGINPGLYTAAVGRHFARPGNRFWPALHDGGFTRRLLDPSEERELLKVGCGITNLVARATARADELADEELADGARKLVRKIRRYRPTCVAFVGVTAYRKAFDEPDAQVGRHTDDLAGDRVWILPNTSGLNAHYQAKDFARLFRRLRQDVDSPE